MGRSFSTVQSPQWAVVPVEEEEEEEDEHQDAEEEEEEVPRNLILSSHCTLNLLFATEIHLELFDIYAKQ
jgi:hypothetical protein